MVRPHIFPETLKDSGNPIFFQSLQNTLEMRLWKFSRDSGKISIHSGNFPELPVQKNTAPPTVDEKKLLFFRKIT